LGRALTGVLLLTQLRCSSVRVEDGSGGERQGAAAVDGGGGAAGAATGAASAVGGSGGELNGAGGTAGAGGMPEPLVPPIPPCFPAVVDDFSDASASAATWIASNVNFVNGTAVLGADRLFVTSLELPYSLAEGETKLHLVRYDAVPAFWVDNVSVLPDKLILTFPGP
jgi:hypothetical protein